MINVSRQRRVPFAPEIVFGLLANPANLPRLMERIERVDVGALESHAVPVTAYFNFGSRLGRRSAPGLFKWTNDSISFEALEPITIVACWTLQPANQQTLVTAALSFNLRPILGPLAVMAPTTAIKRNIGHELDSTLERVEALLSAPSDA